MPHTVLWRPGFRPISFPKHRDALVDCSRHTSDSCGAGRTVRSAQVMFVLLAGIHINHKPVEGFIHKRFDEVFYLAVSSIRGTL